MTYLDLQRRIYGHLCSRRSRSPHPSQLLISLTALTVLRYNSPWYVAISLNSRPPSITSKSCTSVESPTETNVLRSGEKDAASSASG